jgi:cation-transporting ATPase E
MLTTLMGAAIYAIDYDIVLNAVKGLYAANGARAHAGDVPDAFRRTYESYTGISFGSEGYRNIVATVTAQGSLSIFISWTAVLLILFLEPPGRFFLGWRKEVSPDRRPAVLAAVLFAVLLIVWSVDPIGYYFGVLEKPWFVIAAIMGAVAAWFFLIRAVWRANLLERFLGLAKDE